MKKNFTKGFTLIETIVATSMFVIIAGGALNLFMSSLSAQQYVLSSERLTDELSVFMESLSRSLREAERDSAGACIAANFTYEQTVPSEVSYFGSDGNCHHIYLDTVANVIEEIIFPPLGTPSPPTGRTTNNIIVENFFVELFGESAADVGTVQPRITVFVEAVSGGASLGDVPRILLQTSISKRVLNTP